MSIFKEALIETFQSKGMKHIFSGLGFIFILLFSFIFWMFSDLFFYKETSHSVNKIDIVIKAVVNKKDKQDIYYSYGQEDVTHMFSISACKVNKNISGKSFKVDIVDYSYNTFFRQGTHKRIHKPEETFCPKNV